MRVCVCFTFTHSSILVESEAFWTFTLKTPEHVDADSTLTQTRQLLTLINVWQRDREREKEIEIDIDRQIKWERQRDRQGKTKRDTHRNNPVFVWSMKMKLSHMDYSSILTTEIHISALDKGWSVHYWSLLSSVSHRLVFILLSFFIVNSFVYPFTSFFYFLVCFSGNETLESWRLEFDWLSALQYTSFRQVHKLLSTVTWCFGTKSFKASCL